MFDKLPNTAKQNGRGGFMKKKNIANSFDCRDDNNNGNSRSV